MPNQPWIDRTWEFGSPPGRYSGLVERLRGMPARLEEALAGRSATQLTSRVEGSWSIQENAGHLLSLEPLLSARLVDFLCGAEVLTAADMSNRATDEADYHARPIADILASFRRARGELVKRLDELAAVDFARESLHPRLARPMRLVDLCLFHADHDDHHLERIQELIRLVRSSPESE